MKQSLRHSSVIVRQTLLNAGRLHAFDLVLASGVLVLLLSGWLFLSKQHAPRLSDTWRMEQLLWRAHQQVGVVGHTFERAVLPIAVTGKNTQANSSLELQALQSQVAQLEAENQSLRTQLNLPLTDQAHTVRVPIISLDQKLLEYPKSATPKVGQLVVRDGVLLGRVVEVVGQRARVDLLAEKSFPNLVVQTSRGTTGIVVSQKGNSILTQVPSQLPLLQDDVVLTSEQLLAPSGLIIGTLRGVQLDDTGSVQTAIVLPGASFGAAAEVEILDWPL